MSSDAEILPSPARTTDVREQDAGSASGVWFQVGVFGLAFLLTLALPARRGPPDAGPPDAVTTSPRHPSESTAPNTRGE